MKINYLITVVLIIGVIVLFFFPSPEDNFLAYIGTALFFIILVIFLRVWHKKKKSYIRK
jgi:FtsH-binding integral membrane protein